MDKGIVLSEWQVIIGLLVPIILGAVVYTVKKYFEFMISKNLAWREKRREQIVGVSELFSLFHKWKYFPIDQAEESKYELQKKYWELCLWLDAELIRDINNAFTSFNQNKDEFAAKEAMIRARKHLTGKDDDLKPEEITHWLSQLEHDVINVKLKVNHEPTNYQKTGK